MNVTAGGDNAVMDPDQKVWDYLDSLRCDCPYCGAPMVGWELGGKGPATVHEDPFQGARCLRSQYLDGPRPAEETREHGDHPEDT